MTTTPTRELNGVDTETLFATIGAVRNQPELARFQFRTTTEYVRGTHNRTTFGGFHGAGDEHEHRQTYTADADHPAVLVGKDNAPTPAEHLLQALGACLTSGLANIAAARGIELGEVTARVEGDIDLRGILGIDDARAQRVRGHPRHLPRQWRGRGRAARPPGRAGPRAFGGVRRAHQRRPRRRSTWPPPDDVTWSGPDERSTVLRTGRRGSMKDMVLVLDGTIELDEQLFEVRRDGAAVPLEPQAFDVLVYLVRHRDRVVPKEELMDSVWGGRFVSETAVTSRIKQVRRAVGDDGHAQRIDPHAPRARLPLRRRRRRDGSGRGHGDRASPGRAGPRTGTRRSATPSATTCTSPTRSPAAVTSTSC